MTKAQRAQERETTPPQIAEGLPTFAGSDYSFVLQGVFEIQKTLGRVEKALEGLEAREKDRDKAIESLRSDVHAAKVGGAIVVTVVAIAAWFFSNLSHLRSFFHR